MPCVCDVVRAGESADPGLMCEAGRLRGELISFLGEICPTRLAGYDLSYRPDDGLEVTCAG